MGWGVGGLGRMVCAGGMSDMRLNFYRLASLIDKPVIPDLAERKKNVYQYRLHSR